MGDRIVVMNTGRIEQTGRPLDLYRQPASEFVARFVGLPEINVFSGRIEVGDHSALFLASGLLSPLPLAGAWRCGPANLGLRPQALEGRRGGAPAGRIPLGEGSVVAVEHHGPESFATCELGEIRLVVEVAPTSGIAIRDRIGVYADLADIHLFNPADGRRIGALERSKELSP
jgi:ABC-type sugar transport system ATPase subunit